MELLYDSREPYHTNSEHLKRGCRPAHHHASRACRPSLSWCRIARKWPGPSRLGWDGYCRGCGRLLQYWRVFIAEAQRL